MNRIILHIDLDSFFASAEEVRRPDIRGKVVVVCVYSGRTPDSGAVSTANYKAREYGIRAGVPIKIAKEKARGLDAVFLPVDKQYYQEVSNRIMDLIEEQGDRIQQASIDEAYLDVSTKADESWITAKKLAEKIKKKILDQEGLTCSIGIGPNKFVAKMASDFRKPDGLTLVRPEYVKEFLKDIPVIKLHGIGPKTASALEEMGIERAGQLASVDQAVLEEKFGANKAKLLFEKALGVDDSPVERQEKKQLGRMGTLQEDTRDPDRVMEKIKELALDLRERIKEKKVRFRTVSVIFVSTRLEDHSRSATIPETDDLEPALDATRKLVESFLSENPDMVIRRCGIRVSNLEYGGGQMTLEDF